MRVPLRETAVIALNGSGNGTAKVGPLSAREIWYPGNVHVSATKTANEAKCQIFAGLDTTQNNFRDETPLGSTGDSSGTVSQDTIGCGAAIFAVWTGGDAFAQAVLTVTGTKEV